MIEFFLPQDLKDCSVVLDRLSADDKAGKREAEEKEDLNRKGGKPMSRIPTFHKRPVGGSQNAELTPPKKDTPVHVAQPSEKTGSVEASKSKPPDARALPLPSVRVPKIGSEASSPFSSNEHAAAAAHSSIKTTPKSWSLSESVQYPLMTVTPRPALRPEQGLEQHLPEQDERKMHEIEAETIPDAPISHLPYEGSIIHKPPADADEKYDTVVKSRSIITAYGDTEKPEISQTTEDSQEEAIMDEEPPWETEPTNLLELKDSRSSSDIECEDDSAHEKSEVHESGEVEEHHHKPLTTEPEFLNLKDKGASVDDLTSAVAPEKPAKASSPKSTKVGYVFFCSLSSTDICHTVFFVQIQSYKRNFTTPCSLGTALTCKTILRCFPDSCQSYDVI